MNDSVKNLLAGASEIADRREQRGAWVRKTGAACRRAMREMDDRLGEAVDRVSEAEFNRLWDEEQAKVDAIRKQLEDAAYRDLWPKHLYFGAV